MNYRDTLNLPKTDFPMKAALSLREPDCLKIWDELKLNNLIRQKSKDKEKYILHDGPPYANGNVHVGTALNKILKDIVVKYKTMKGYDAVFVPGWDCHGTPIEIQLLKNLKVNAFNLDIMDFRKKCREYAASFVDVQRKQFMRLGIFGEWHTPYLTMDKNYEAKIIETFKELVKGGYIYQGKKPVHWCIHCKTALAEAEVEYADATSPSIYVKFRVKEESLGVLSLEKNTPVNFLIWTTTPWTLPANVAIAVSPQEEYSIIEINSEYIILASSLLNSVVLKLQINDYKVVSTIKGSNLENIKCRHPFVERDSQVICGLHVTMDQGTGCVHTAPGHGQEDYEIGLKYNLPVVMPVSDDGKYTNDFSLLAGTQVFEADSIIVKLLKEKNALLWTEDYLHSYPHCWRCKKPVIFRSTEQWFMSIDKNNLREKLMTAISNVKWIPSQGQNRIASMVETRPDWCISRQRFWGVPLPIFYCVNCKEPLLDEKVINTVEQMVREEGSDVWFLKSEKEILPQGTKCSKCEKEEFKKSKDILDVWFDSAVSHIAVLKTRDGLKWPADLYLEGSDQHRGWFQVSLITSMAIFGVPPFNAVLTHGYTVDGEGKKMSKSLGNLTTAEDAVKKYGADIIRLWIMSENYQNDVRFGEEILVRLIDSYRRIRNTCKYLLGNLYDFEPQSDTVIDNELFEIDRWALLKLNKLIKEANTSYENFEFYKFYQAIHNFCAVEMSSFYLDVLKDRMYIFKAKSPQRKSGQTAMYNILINIAKLCAPMLSFTADEVWQHLRKITGEKLPKSVHLADWPIVNETYLDESLEKRWDELLEIRACVLIVLEKARQAKIIGHPLEAKIQINIFNEETYNLLKNYSSQLPAIFVISQVIIVKVDKLSLQNPHQEEEGFEKIEADKVQKVFKNIEAILTKADGKKCERCWNYSESVGINEEHPTICSRCTEILL